MEDKEKVIRRIKKMLAMAKGGANPHESATAAAMAARLMRKHQLTEADVLSEQYQANGVYVAEYENPQGDITEWMQGLALGVAKLFDCEVKHNGISFLFFGMEDDCIVAREVFTYLLLDVWRLGRESDICCKFELEDFYTGCMHSIRARLEQEAREATQEKNSTEAGKGLVVLKRELIQKATGLDFSTKDVLYKPRNEDVYVQGFRSGLEVELELSNKQKVIS